MGVSGKTWGGCGVLGVGSGQVLGTQGRGWWGSLLFGGVSLLFGGVPSVWGVSEGPGARSSVSGQVLGDVGKVLGGGPSVLGKVWGAQRELWGSPPVWGGRVGWIWGFGGGR